MNQHSFVNKTYINNVVNKIMYKQKKHNKTKAFIMMGSCIAGIGMFLCFSHCIWNYSISVDPSAFSLHEILKSSNPTIMCRKIILIFLFTVGIFPIFYFFNSGKKFGVFSIGLKQNRGTRTFIKYFSPILQLLSSLSLSLGVVISKDPYSACVLLLVFLSLFPLIYVTKKDTDKANFNFDKYVCQLKAKGLISKDCPICCCYSDIELFKKRYEIISKSKLLNISKDEYSNMMDNMW